MIHARTQIKEAVIALLKDNTSAGDNVFSSRIYAINEPKLPALLVYTKPETVGEQSISYPRTQHRELTVTIEIYVKSNSDVDDAADALALEIEQLIAAAPQLGGLVKDMVLDNTDIKYLDEGEKPIAVAILTYAVLYTVKEHEPHALI